ncbi:MAG: hypothetical protein OEZ02_03230 [Anaerolineae bacterium]|nr:hypothetical protein [Anaerolineae bacterium]
MSKRDWQVIDEVPGELQGELIKAFLEAQGILVHLSQEGLGRIYGLSATPMGIVQILVPTDMVEDGKKYIAEYYGEQASKDNSAE